MKIKIVADSSANLWTLENMDFSSVPLKIVAGDKEYVDDEKLDVSAMQKALKEYKGKSSTACPSVADWLCAFGDADLVLGAAITGNLSGSYNSARLAAEEYMEDNPGKKVFILDSLSAGPELKLLIEKYEELIVAGAGFEEICAAIKAYSTRTHLMFSLASLSNFARNGRVSPAVAALVGIMGIRIVGQASAVGDLEPMHKCRGESRAIKQLYDCIMDAGYSGGKVRIDHSYNAVAAVRLATMIKKAFPESDVQIGSNRGLCCYYAEEGGILVGFEA